MKNTKLFLIVFLVTLTTGLLLPSIELRAGNTQPETIISNNSFTCESEVHPNSMSFMLNFYMNSGSEVDIHLYDQCGNDLGSVYKGYLNAGEADVNIDFTALPIGTYVCEIKAGNNTQYLSLQKTP